MFKIKLALLWIALLASLHGMAAAQTPIQHVIVIVQENRSFDHYFGTYPGADGIQGSPCLPLSMTNPQLGCVTPFHDPNDVNVGAPHSAAASQADIDDGINTTLMDGFEAQQYGALGAKCAPDCSGKVGVNGILRHDVMGYHTADDIPNYWSYAQNFVLQDHMFENARSWSLISHLYMLSEWAAACSDQTNAATCQTSDLLLAPTATTEYPWANLMQMLDMGGVSWKYYLGTGTEPDCEDDAMSCPPQIQTASVPSYWNPVGYFASSQAGGAAYMAAHDVPSDQFIQDVKGGTLPQVSWIVPADAYSEHPPNGITAGMEYVTSLVNAVMQSPYWQNTAIFVTWDDWGGFYDHEPPPNVDLNASINPVQGYGLRVPGLTISAYARAGMIDHSVLSMDSYATFIEDVFLNGARLDPAAMGNPDSRPTQRDAMTSVTFVDNSTAPVGRLMDEFDFTQTPLAPVLLSTHIPTGIATKCSSLKPPALQCNLPTVVVSWKPVAGPLVPGPFTYQVTRDGVALTGCVVTAVSCKDRPGSGTHYYRVLSIDGSHVASPPSAAAEADEP